MARGFDIGFGQGAPTLQASRGLFSSMGGFPNLSFAAGGGPGNTGIGYHPGHYALSYNVDGYPTSVGGNGRNQAEMTTLGEAPTGFQGYIAQVNWRSMEGATPGSWFFGASAAVDRIGADFLALQATPGCNGMHYCVLVKTYADPISITSANIGNTWSSNAPDYILNGDSTYGALGPNGKQRGYVLSQNEPVSGAYNFTYAQAAKHVPGVISRYTALFAAIASAIVPDCTINGKLYSGYTYDTHPYVEMVGDWDEFSLAYAAPAIPSDYTASGEITQWGDLYQGIAGAFPHTITVGFVSYGNGTQTTQTIPNLAALIAAANAGNFFLSNADTYQSWTVYGTGVTAQMLYAGNSFTSTSDERTYVSGGGTDERTARGYFSMVQAGDYGPENSVAAIQAIYNNAVANTVGTPGSTTNINTGLNAPYIGWCMSNSAGTPNWFKGYVQPTVKALATNLVVPTSIAGRTVS